MKKILETERLVLREIEPTDAEVLYNLNLDPEVIRYTGDSPFASVAETETFLTNYADYRKFGYGRWGVIRKEDDEFLGWCGLKYHPDENYTDLGYRFFRKFWGFGYATEAAKGCLAYGFNKLNLDYLIGTVMHENLSSVNVLEKAGLQYWKEDLCEKHPAQVYRINKAEFQNLQP
ncbi:GNAT family N-acetyltransferase [Adhaeribacter soli]|uniref:GNAT family N-acetyltransferase n=1 Tax=Adhaeribacter soli TaxID=2607655 RepID=A0A5N1J9C9_9BACT|nr:GNAT family N-acetyltransferase [Adhaeribacter soli]KAA9345915.1 GNAT family N-acetyltransferase [Adhaeribacter soli]